MLNIATSTRLYRATTILQCVVIACLSARLAMVDRNEVTPTFVITENQAPNEIRLVDEGGRTAVLTASKLELKDGDRRTEVTAGTFRILFREVIVAELAAHAPPGLGEEGPAGGLLTLRTLESSIGVSVGPRSQKDGVVQVLRVLDMDNPTAPPQLEVRVDESGGRFITRDPKGLTTAELPPGGEGR